MRPNRPKRVWDPDSGVLEIVQVILLLQAGFAVLSVFEVVTVGVTTGTMPLLVPSAMLATIAALTALVLVAGLGRRSALARRLVVVGEWLVVLGALVDLALALLMAKSGLDLMPMLTRLGLPIGVVVLLRRPRRSAVPLQGEPS
jgi:hypothetical protein